MQSFGWMRGPAVVPGLLLLSVLAGCLGDAADETLTPDLGLPVGLVQSLNQAPDWRIGEWWDVSYTLEVGNQAAQTVRLVSLGVDDGVGRIGMPADGFDGLALISHWPMMGEIAMDTLRIPLHDTVIHHAQWPMEDGVSFVTSPNMGGISHVTVDGPGEAKVIVADFLFPITYTYDANLRFIRDMEIPGYGSFHVVAHGFDHAGPVVLPTQVTMPIFKARAIGVVDVSTPPALMIPAPLPAQAGAPVDRVVVPTAGQAALFMLVGNFDLVPVNTPGYYRETTQLPDGSMRELQRTPADGMGRTVLFEMLGDPAGTWTMAHAAIGGGIVFTELMSWMPISYRVEGGRALETAPNP